MPRTPRLAVGGPAGETTLILMPTINYRHWNACYLQLLSVQRCQHPPTGRALLLGGGVPQQQSALDPALPPPRRRPPLSTLGSCLSVRSRRLCSPRLRARLAEEGPPVRPLILVSTINSRHWNTCYSYSCCLYRDASTPPGQSAPAGGGGGPPQQQSAAAGGGVGHGFRCAGGVPSSVRPLLCRQGSFCTATAYAQLRSDPNLEALKV